MTFDASEIDEGPGALRTIYPHLSKRVMVKLSAFIEIKRETESATLVQSLRHLHELWEDETWTLELRAVALLLADLIDQGWVVTATDDSIQLQPPGLRIVGESMEQSKERIRRALQTGRDRQLADPGVEKFLGRMHRVVSRAQGRSSIADVIENGADLADLIRPLTNISAEEAAIALKDVIDPVIEVCEENAKCSVTGLRLIDIWRYFRHTWSLEYRSMPGRQIAFLIRNAARPKKPVIGIAMLASPVLRSRVRDDWIGWNAEKFVERLKAGKWDTDIALRALVTRLEQSIGEIRSDDLTTADELVFPSERTILRLEQRSAAAALTRQRELEESYTQSEEANEAIRSQRDQVKGNAEGLDWSLASEEALFVRKRAETLAKLLDTKRTFQALDWNKEGQLLLDELLHHPNGWRTLNVALQEVRKAGLSSQIADLSVCGAVAPYNVLLGGKLVALLMTSREVREAYRARYVDQVSIISSQMAGRPIQRPADLKILTTTSLYGNGSSQYNRLKLLAQNNPELEHDVEWKELSTTAGYGSVHLSTATVRVLREVSERTYRARRINNRFGEGASPRLRQIREAVEVLGVDSNAILHHATPRIFYGCELYPGSIEDLLGLRTTGQYEAPSASVIAKLWRKRWLSKRIQRPETIEKIRHIGSATFSADFAKSQTFNNSTEETNVDLEEKEIEVI